MANSYSFSDSIVSIDPANSNVTYTGFTSQSWTVGAAQAEDRDLSYSMSYQLLSTNYNSYSINRRVVNFIITGGGAFPNCIGGDQVTITETISGSSFGSTESAEFYSSSTVRFGAGNEGSSTLSSSRQECFTTKTHYLAGNLCDAEDPTRCFQLDPCPTWIESNSGCVSFSNSGSGTQDNVTRDVLNLSVTKSTGSAEVSYNNPNWTISADVIKTNSSCFFSLTNTKTSGDIITSSTTQTDTIVTYEETDDPDVFKIEVTTDVESYYTTETQTDWTQTTQTSTTKKTQTDVEAYTTTEADTTSVTYDAKGKSGQENVTATSNSTYLTTGYTATQDTTETTDTGGSTTTATALTTDLETTTTDTETSYAVSKTDSQATIYTTSTSNITWETGNCSYIITKECKTYETSELFPTPDNGTKAFPATYTGLPTFEETGKSTRTNTDSDTILKLSTTYTFPEGATVLTVNGLPNSRIDFAPSSSFSTVHASEIDYSLVYPIRDVIPCGNMDLVECEDRTSGSYSMPFFTLTNIAQFTGSSRFVDTDDLDSDNNPKSYTITWVERTVSSIDYNTTETETESYAEKANRTVAWNVYPNAKMLSTEFGQVTYPETYWSTFRCLSSWVTNATKDDTDQLSWTWGTFRKSNIITYWSRSTWTRYVDDPNVQCTIPPEPDEDGTIPPPPPESSTPPKAACPDGIGVYYDFQVFDIFQSRINNVYYEQKPFGYIGFGENVPDLTSSVEKYFAGLSTEMISGDTFSSDQELNVEKSNISTYAVKLGIQDNKALLFPTRRCEPFGYQIGTTAWATNENLINFDTSTEINATYTSTTDTFVTLPPDITITSTETTAYATYGLSMTYSYDNVSSFSANLPNIQNNASQGAFFGSAVMGLRHFDISLTQWRNQLSFITYNEGTTESSSTYDITRQVNWETVMSKGEISDMKKRKIAIDFYPWGLCGTFENRYIAYLQGFRNNFHVLDKYISRNFNPTYQNNNAFKLGYRGPLIENCPIIET